MTDTSGPMWPQPLAYYDRASSCWRTSQGTFLWDSMPSSLTLPAWGTTRSGELYGLPTPALLTSGPACSSSPPLLLPTPAVNDMGAGKTVEAWDDWTERMKAKHRNGNGHGRSLTIEVSRLLLPTPNARDGKGCRPEPVTPGLHLPEALKELSTGVPIRLRSDAGKPSSAGPHPTQLSLGDEAPPPSTPRSPSG